MATKLFFGDSPIETTPNWFVVHYMVEDETGEYAGRQFFDTIEDAEMFVKNGGAL